MRTYCAYTHTQMHDRNPYRGNPPNFQRLAALYPDFALHVSREGKLDFNDPAALLSLTKTLLLNDFKLDWEIPLTRLCPAVPNRINYLLWVEDLLAISTSQLSSSSLPSSLPTPPYALTPDLKRPLPEPSASTTAKTVGIDIGTGASAIFPLLGCRMNDTWRFLATELDDISASCAEDNVIRNGLGDRISILRQHKDAPLLAQVLATPMPSNINILDSACRNGSATSADCSTLYGNCARGVGASAAATTTELGTESTFAFLMCNPPFFDMGHIMPENTATGKSAVDSETMCNGGEVGFVTRLARESVVSSTRVVWFTSMLGKKASIQPLMNVLRELGASSILSTQLIQGKTMRWAIAWSFVVDYHSGQSGSAKRRREASPSYPSLKDSSQRRFSIEGVRVAELSQRLSEYVNAEQSQRQSDFQIMDLSAIENDDNDDGGKHEWLIVTDSPALQMHVVFTEIKKNILVTDAKTEAGAGNHVKDHADDAAENEPVESVALVKLVSLQKIVSPMLLDRTLSNIERDLKRTGRYWRRKLKRRKKGQHIDSENACGSKN